MPVIRIFQRFRSFLFSEKDLREILWWSVPWLFADFCACFFDWLSLLTTGVLSLIFSIWCLSLHFFFYGPYFYIRMNFSRLPKSRVFLGRKMGEMMPALSDFGSLEQRNVKNNILELPPTDPVTVTTRIIPFLVGNRFKPSFVTVTGWGVDRKHIYEMPGSLWIGPCPAVVRSMPMKNQRLRTTNTKTQNFSSFNVWKSCWFTPPKINMEPKNCWFGSMITTPFPNLGGIYFPGSQPKKPWSHGKIHRNDHLLEGDHGDPVDLLPLPKFNSEFTRPWKAVTETHPIGKAKNRLRLTTLALSGGELLNFGGVTFQSSFCRRFWCKSTPQAPISLSENSGNRRHFLGAKQMGVSKNSGTPKSSILMGFSIINHPFWGTSIFGTTQIETMRYSGPVEHFRFVGSHWWVTILKQFFFRWFWSKIETNILCPTTPNWL